MIRIMYQKLSISLALTAFLVFEGIFSLKAGAADDVDENQDFVTLAIGEQYDHPLPEEYKSLRLKFEGNYTKYTQLFYIKKQNVIRFVPKRKGVGALVIKNLRTNRIIRKLNISVKNTFLHRVANEISDLLTPVDGIRVRILNNKVIIDGEILLPRDMIRIQTVVKEYGKNVSSLVTFSPDAQNQVARLIEKEIGNPSVTVKAVYNRFILEGTVDTGEEKERAVLIANLYTQYDEAMAGGKLMKKSFKSVTDRIRVREDEEKPQEDKRKKLIHVTVHYVELKKDYNKGFLFQWTPVIGKDGTRITATYGGQGAARSGGLHSVLSAIIQNFLPKLNWAKSFGFARVLHNSSLIMEEGVKGVISSKVNVPITISTPSGVQATTQPRAMINTVVTPNVTGPRKDTVQMAVQFTVSSPVGQSQGNPVIAERTISTSLHVRSGLSAALGGLISASVTRDYNRLPKDNTGGHPIISLFSSKNYDANRSQFVVFVTPIIKSSASLGVERIKEKFQVNQD